MTADLRVRAPLALSWCPALVLVMLSACSTPPAAPPPAPPAPAPAPQVVAAPAPAPAPKPPAAQPSSTPASTVASVALPPHLDAKSLVSMERTVNFDYDDFAIKSQYAPLIERHGKYLATNPNLKVRVEGHADERGGREYNLALGQRRAEAVARALRIYGVQDAQLDARSWGEDKPLAAGHDETAWAQNRRAVVEYPAR